jgi:hypothetical protein
MRRHDEGERSPEFSRPLAGKRMIGLLPKHLRAKRFV